MNNQVKNIYYMKSDGDPIDFLFTMKVLLPLKCMVELGGSQVWNSWNDGLNYENLKLTKLKYSEYDKL